MRIEEFKIERPGLVDIGDKVEIVERSTVAFYYYLVLPATAMSGNYPYSERIKSRTGIVRDIVKNEKGTYLQIEFEN
ncbi:MAG: hypothetical protein ILP10_08040 [Lachnospiraceae bacterium]|nr:hypothetical protein [Lachnospiraceae bacterium]